MPKHPFPPLYDKNSKELILGSFPSVKSREQMFFYGHPQNRFWKVVSAVMGTDIPVTIEEKSNFLHANHIALWDVIASCDITGSSDSSIKNVVANDLTEILENADIRQIFVNGKTAEKYYNKYIRDTIGELQAIPQKIQQALDMNTALPQLAKKYNSGHSVFYIGRNTDYAVALEGALKMKESSYIHAEAYAAGELKHGTIALIDEGQSVIAICCNSRIAEKTMSNIVEVKARGAQVLALAVKGNRAVLAQADDVIYIPDLDPLFQAVVEIVPLQLLAYYVAKENGCDIDKPKNLAKSVTVE